MPKAKPKPVKGRPAIDPEARRKTLIKVLVTETEDQLLRAAAKAADLTVSSWMRKKALEAAGA
jgi:uncharacterized protein (DUF1778 family)